MGARLAPVSWLSIARGTSISSPHTTQAYVEDLEKLFIVKVLNLLSTDSKILYRKNKKIHIADPFLYNTICELVNVKLVEEDRFESVVVTHLARKYPVFYWRNKTEVDVVVMVDNRQLGIEVKTVYRSWIKPKHLKDVLILTRPEIPLFLTSIDV